MSKSRYIVGIDLGTTNTVMSYIDLTEKETETGTPTVHTFGIPQSIAPNVVDTKDSLPSFLYLAARAEFAENALDLPWASSRNFSIGWFAREQGSKVPARVVSSSKSWLCHSGVDRSAPILPWQAPADVEKISPVDSAARILEHLRDAWNAHFAKDLSSAKLEQQTIFLTVPASFDDIARELTLTAARRAGFSHITLLEEPQAAFYAWLHHQGEGWRSALTVGDIILVCDIGGGTTDFSLIAVKDDGRGSLALERIAVGEHILLGGDNMDLALALTVSQRLAAAGTKLDPWQTRSLWHACRSAKETMLSDLSVEETPVTVLGRGSKVIGGSIKGILTRADINTVLLNGFIPACDVTARPAKARRTGLQELGLPYAADAAITKHLAQFLSAHAATSTSASSNEFLRPTAILFNGGVMKAEPLQTQIVRVVDQWLETAHAPAVKRLESQSLDLAVSRGAAYYGLVRQGRGIRIRGGVARSYYIGIESALPAVPGLEVPLKALCVVPFGMEEGTEADLSDQEFGLIVGEPVEFRFFSSTTRKHDAVGTLLEKWDEDELEELRPIQTAMNPIAATEEHPIHEGATVPVRLHTSVTPIGTLDLQLCSREGQAWKLEYNVRNV